MQQHPRVGVGVVVRRGGHILLGQRCGPTSIHPAFFMLTEDHECAQEGFAGRRRMGAARCDVAALPCKLTGAAETSAVHRQPHMETLETLIWTNLHCDCMQEAISSWESPLRPAQHVR